jgi:ribosome-associated protein
VDPAPDVLRVTHDCAIDLAELEWRFETSSGSGGQHANRARTRVAVTFDIASSPNLTERQRERLRSRLGDRVQATAEDERSQFRNRAIALDRLRSRLAAGLHEERPRRPTRPSRAARHRRMEAKRRRSEVKRTRGRPQRDDS